MTFILLTLSLTSLSIAVAYAPYVRTPGGVSLTLIAGGLVPATSLWLIG